MIVAVEVLLGRITNQQSGLNIRWMLRVWLDLAPQVADMGIQCPSHALIGIAHRLFQQVIAGEGVAGVGEKGFQQFKLGWGEFDLRTIDRERVLVQV